jgi:hypothetical protein
MRRVQEQILGRERQNHMRIAQIDCDVTFADSFLQQTARQLLQILEGLGEQQPAPPAIDHSIRFELGVRTLYAVHNDFRQGACPLEAMIDMFPGRHVRLCSQLFLIRLE